jgi:hypothetical protein
LCDVNKRFIACSVESLARRLTKQEKVRIFDVVVVDEATAHVKQLLSDGTMDDDTRNEVWTAHVKQLLSDGTMDDDTRNEVWAVTEAQLQSAKVVIFMCADLNDELRKMCIEIRSRNASTYRCRVESRGYTTHIDTIPSVKHTICAVLNKSKSNNVWVATNSRTQGLDVRKVIQRQAIERGQLDLANGVLLLTGQDGDGLSRAEREEILSWRRLGKHIPKQIYVLSSEGKAELIPNKQKAEFDVRAFIYTPARYHTRLQRADARETVHARLWHFQLGKWRLCAGCISTNVPTSWRQDLLRG